MSQLSQTAFKKKKSRARSSAAFFQAQPPAELFVKSLYCNMSENQVSQYDFRLNADGLVRADLEATLRELASKWTFQLERGDSGYMHYQGRLSLKKKRRVAEIKMFWRKQYADGNLLVDLPNYLAPTSRPSTGDAFYVTKLDTRVEGPWSDRDQVKVLTRQLREFLQHEMYPWQQKVMAMAEELDDRYINIIYDTRGNLGKSVFCEWMEYEGRAFEVPPFRLMEDLMGFVMSFKVYPAYMVDMPRGMKKDRLGEFYSGLETLKNGVAYDKRYEGRKMRFDRPQIFVFTNTLPEFSLMSRDRWRVMEVTPDRDLQRIAVEDDYEMEQDPCDES